MVHRWRGVSIWQVDETGYLLIDRAGAKLLFLLISRCCERGPTILTGNQRFGI